MTRVEYFSKAVSIGHYNSCLSFFPFMKWTQCEYRYSSTWVFEGKNKRFYTVASVHVVLESIYNLINWLHLVIWLPQVEANNALKEKIKANENSLQDIQVFSSTEKYCPFNFLVVPIKTQLFAMYSLNIQVI